MGEFVNCKQHVQNEDGELCAAVRTNSRVGNINNFMTRVNLMQHRENPGFGQNYDVRTESGHRLLLKGITSL